MLISSTIYDLRRVIDVSTPKLGKNVVYFVVVFFKVHFKDKIVKLK